MFKRSLFLIFTIYVAIQNVECDFRYSPRIIGGQEGKIERFKWQVALLYDSKYFCGATIISPTKIVSAAHCTYQITNFQKVQVRAGSSHPTQGGTLKAVLKILQHPDFNKPTSLNNDVSVLILKEALTFGSTIGGIPLAGKSISLNPGQMVTASGFGSTKINSDDPDVLHYVSVPIVDQNECVKAYKKYPGKAKVTKNMFCAGFYGTGGKDACKGDSGGPLIFEGNNTAPILYGIISWGSICADPKFPGVYAKVSVYRDWINDAK